MTPPVQPQNAGRFSMIPSRALDDRSMTPQLIRMLALLGCYSDRDGWCYPSMRKLAERIGVSLGTVHALTHRLADLGYISISRQYGKGGGNINNMYRLLFDAQIPAERDMQTLSTPEVNTPPVQSRAEHPVQSRAEHPVQSRAEHPVQSRAERNVPIERTHAMYPENEGAGAIKLTYAQWLQSDDGHDYLRQHNIDPHTFRSSQLLTAYREWRVEHGWERYE